MLHYGWDTPEEDTTPVLSQLKTDEIVQNNHYSRTSRDFITYSLVEQVNSKLDELKLFIMRNYKVPDVEPVWSPRDWDSLCIICPHCGCVLSKCIESELGTYCVRAVQRRMVTEGEGVFTYKQMLVEYTVWFNRSFDALVLRDFSNKMLRIFHREKVTYH